jgi:hypothetical protein
MAARERAWPLPPPSAAVGRSRQHHRRANAGRRPRDALNHDAASVPAAALRLQASSTACRVGVRLMPEAPSISPPSAQLHLRTARDPSAPTGNRALPCASPPPPLPCSQARSRILFALASPRVLLLPRLPRAPACPRSSRAKPGAGPCSRRPWRRKDPSEAAAPFVSPFWCLRRRRRRRPVPRLLSGSRRRVGITHLPPVDLRAVCLVRAMVDGRATRGCDGRCARRAKAMGQGARRPPLSFRSSSHRPPPPIGWPTRGPRTAPSARQTPAGRRATGPSARGRAQDTRQRPAYRLAHAGTGGRGRRPHPGSGGHPSV